MNDNVETLFSFELLVECVRIEKESKVSDELALGVRLLDFPTLLIYQSKRGNGDINQQDHANALQGEYAFNRGKSCFFKMNLNSLHTQLSNSPLYAMVLDVKEEIPRLVGTSLISLANVMDRIRRDVTENGASTASSHGERGLVGIFNLTEEKIGSISLSYKLLSLGSSLLPHITDSRGLKSTTAHGDQQTHQGVTENNISAELLPLDSGNVYPLAMHKSDVSRNIINVKPTNENTLINEDKQENGVATQTEQKSRKQTQQTLKESDSFEDLTVFCPPHLFYSNSAEEKNRSEEGDCKFLNLDSEAFTFEDTCSEDETTENKGESVCSPMINQGVRHSVKMSGNQGTSGMTPNVLGEALQQLPLLNALLVELSQLNNQNPHQSLSIHPNLAWIYRPVSTEPSSGHGNTAKKAPTTSSQKAKGVSTNLKHLHSPRHCSTPIVRPASVKVKDKQQEALTESKKTSTFPKKTLVYGTTKTFNLRLKLNSALRVKRHECRELIQSETQSSLAKGKTKSSNKIMKSSRRKSAFKQSSGVNEDVKTIIESITVDSALQETQKEKNLLEKVYDTQHRHSPRIPETPSLSERGLTCVHIPRVDGNSVAQNKTRNEDHIKSNQSQSDSERHRDKTESSGSSRHSSPKSSFSDVSGERSEEVEYADDFNSLEPSDAYSPDPMSSPEPSRAKTPRSPVRPESFNSDSVSEGFQRRAVLPVPVKAPSSPQRTLRGTRVIRPRTQASALSLSSDDGDRNRSASLQTICSRKQMTESDGVERSSGADSFISRGQRSKSTKSSGPVRGLSAESISSFEPQVAEELEDELGSLDFRKEYQHISELVANKLPGYTI